MAAMHYVCIRGMGSQPGPAGIGQPGHGPHPISNRYSRVAKCHSLLLIPRLLQ